MEILPEWNLDGISWVDECTNSMDSPSVSELQIFPNPASDFIQLSASNLIEEVVIYNILGAVVYFEFPLTSQATLDVRSWKTGVYFMESRSMDGTLSRNKIVIK